MLAFYISTFLVTVFLFRRDYYRDYPSAIPQQPATTTIPQQPAVTTIPQKPAVTTRPQQNTELFKPNEIKPAKPLADDGKSLSDLLSSNLGFGTESQTNGQSAINENIQPTDGKSLLELINEEKGSTGGGQSLTELLGGHQTTASSTEAPKKSLDDLIGNVFIEKPKSSTEIPEGGKSLFELLAELPPDTKSSGDQSTEQIKKNSDVAGGDYGLDVRTDDSKVKRTKRSILREGLRRITERISNFGKNNHDQERHTRDHDCKHHEGRSHHPHYNHRHQNNYDRDENDNDNRQDAFLENHRPDSHNGRHNGFEHGGHPHPHGHHPHPNFYPHPNKNYDNEEETKSRHNNNQRPLDESENSSQQHSKHDQVIPPSRQPHSADVGTQTDITKTDAEKDVTLDIDVRGGFSETRRKRHNSKRSRRSPDEEVVFQDDDDVAPKVEETVVEDDKKDENATEAVPVNSNATETEGEGDLDSRFGFFGGGGFNRQNGLRPIGSIIGGVVNGIFGGVVGGINGAYDPYNRAPYPGQQPLYGNYPPAPQQPPVHIHINNVANAQSQATNNAGGQFGQHGSNQNAAANAQSENYQNQFGSFQNAGAAGQASNLAADGSSGQLSAANAMNQNYQNQFGAGSKNAAQSQAANFDNQGNLALTSSNSGTNHFAGPGGVRDETNSAAQSSLQGQFGTQNSGAQSNTFQGPNGSGSSASSQASSINNGYGSQNSGANAAANSGNFGGNSFGNAQSGTNANDQWGW